MEAEMTRKSRMFVFLLATLVTLAWLGFSQNSDTAKDPVCGMSVKKDGAKYTYDYKGTTYYFCSAGCQESFAKEPGKYLQPQPGDTAKDPVCGMSVKKDGAKYTYDYKGTTYYFCGASCQDRFAKDPEKYLQKMDAAAPMAGMHGQMAAGKGAMAGCPFLSADVEKKIENVENGVVITLTSGNAEMVKKLQDHAAMMKAGKCPMMEPKEGAAKTEMECTAGCSCKKK
jgi:YHS domain-containing protein